MSVNNLFIDYYRTNVSANLDQLCWLPHHAWRDRDAKQVLGVAVNPCSKIEVKDLLPRLNHTQNLGVIALAWDFDRSSERKIGGVSRHNGSLQPVEAFALDTALVIELR